MIPGIDPDAYEPVRYTPAPTPVRAPQPPTYVPGCPVCDDAKAKGIRPFVRHDNCTCGKRKPHCTADWCW